MATPEETMKNGSAIVGALSPEVGRDDASEASEKALEKQPGQPAGFIEEM
jgi:hypothetical protein